MIDETVIDKSSAVEKIKSIATAKTITVNKKHVSEYSVPFYGKIILCTNKEKDFMRIDKEEVRFWVRKIRPVDKLNTKIEEDLFSEIPKFLKYLSDAPEIDFTRSRMVFTMDEIQTKELTDIKDESKSSLHKEIEMLLEDFFNNSPGLNQFEATAIDIKNKFFEKNSQISHNYIHKVLKNELKITQKGMKRYLPFEDKAFELQKKTGKPFFFVRENAEIEEQISVDFDSKDCPF